MKNYRFILIAFLLGLSIFSVYKYIVSVTEKNELMATLEQIKQEVTLLETARQNLLVSLDKERESNGKLTEENSTLKDNLKANEEKMSQLEADLSQTIKRVDELNNQLTSLKEDKETLTLKLSQVSQENESLQARFNSIDELKKAIRDLKKNRRGVHKAALTQAKIPQQPAKEKAGSGNRGFLVKNGKSTFYSKIRIEVEPVLK
ncbi:MAG: hypothetical protein PHN57_03070 [Candidatus Omnitrophica bacterium]|nr:hypothetical protein [Candidatus Omnitrophota bacterium]